MNRLSKETSPYLLQHADNPVDWYPWGEAAFAKAKKEDKPILVSIGYSTCHWCHVMERESFENEAIAAIMNENFVNIKVDREERPDIDSIYMEAVQIMTGSGGWPLNCFLLPDKRPFFGGTYFPPEARHNRPSWTQVLQNLTSAYQNQKEQVVEQAEKLTNYIHNADNRLLDNLVETKKVAFDENSLHLIYKTIRERFDTQNGGIGSAPKFPASMTLKFCLDYHYFTNIPEALAQVELSLDKMIRGGIYDQIGGGFARYATDKAWLIPHFEKMLYDNALLVALLSEAYQLTGKELYQETIEATLTYVKREMWSDEGGFFAAQDADSEGVEGKFYVWSKDEIDAVLGENSDLFCRFYGVSEDGNWDGRNILWRKDSYLIFAKANSIDLNDFKSTMKRCREQLFQVRDKRIKPSLDDKILLNWNALMTTAFVKAYKALDDEEYLSIAIQNMDFLLKTFEGETHFYHTYKNGKRQHQAFLDDYAFLIAALLQLFEVTQNTIYLTKADELTQFVINEFFDKASKLFFFTSANQTDLITRTKDLYDNALPSGNSTMVHNLQQLGILLGKENYKAIAYAMLTQVQSSIEKYPTSFAKWASAMQNIIHPTHEIAIIGSRALVKAKVISQQFIPNRVIMAAKVPNEAYPLLEGKTVGSDTLIFVCKNYTCQLPVKTVEEVLEIV